MQKLAKLDQSCFYSHRILTQIAAGCSWQVLGRLKFENTFVDSKDSGKIERNVKHFNKISTDVANVKHSELFNTKTNFNKPSHYACLKDMYKLIEQRHGYNADKLYGERKVPWDELKLRAVKAELEKAYWQDKAHGAVKGCIMMN